MDMSAKRDHFFPLPRDLSTERPVKNRLKNWLKRVSGLSVTLNLSL